MKLNDKICKNALRREKTYKLFDGGGLYLEVTKRQQTLAHEVSLYERSQETLYIGEYPIITLSETRTQRDQAKRLLANGLDPSATKKETKITRSQDGANSLKLSEDEQIEALSNIGLANPDLQNISIDDLLKEVARRTKK